MAIADELVLEVLRRRKAVDAAGHELQTAPQEVQEIMKRMEEFSQEITRLDREIERLNSAFGQDIRVREK